MKYKSEFMIYDGVKRFYQGNKVEIVEESGKCISGVISHITNKGVYLESGKPKHDYMNLQEIKSIMPYREVKNLKRVFVSHPFASDPYTNRIKVVKILKELNEKHPDVIFLSPLHLFSYMEGETPEQREEVMDICFNMILISDEVWSYGDSAGCSLEKKFAIDQGKPCINMINN